MWFICSYSSWLPDLHDFTCATLAGNYAILVCFVVVWFWSSFQCSLGISMISSHYAYLTVWGPSRSNIRDTWPCLLAFRAWTNPPRACAGQRPICCTRRSVRVEPLGRLWWERNMMTSSNGNIFRVTGPLWGESTDHLWLLLIKVSDAEPWYFLWSLFSPLMCIYTASALERLHLPLSFILRDPHINDDQKLVGASATFWSLFSYNNVAIGNYVLTQTPFLGTGYEPYFDPNKIRFS